MGGRQHGLNRQKLQRQQHINMRGDGERAVVNKRDVHHGCNGMC